MASLAISALATGAVRLKIQPNASRHLSQGFGRKVFPLAEWIEFWSISTLKVRKYAKCR